MTNNINKIIMPLTMAISELSGDGINGFVYFYEKGQCSCCYGPKLSDFTIEGNKSENMGDYGDPCIDWRVTYEPDKDKANAIARVLRKHLRGTGYKIKWDGDVSTVMWIQPRDIADTDE